MAPALEPDDRLVTRDTAPGPGDVVVARAPDGRTVVKRVVAVGPADVAIVTGSLLVDGAESPWSPPGGMRAAGRWRVPDGHVFLLSDAAHRTDADYRTWGPVATGAVVGVVRWRYRPLGRAGRVV